MRGRAGHIPEQKRASYAELALAWFLHVASVALVLCVLCARFASA